MSGVGEPTVTAIAICYNHSRFLVECLDSIRRQTRQADQLIIVDDYSQDDSTILIEQWIKRYSITCLFLRHNQNMGICRTLNDALSHATGDYIALVSTDDLWMPEKLERQVQQMERLPKSVGVLYGDALMIDERGEPLEHRFIESYRSFAEFPQGNIFEVLLKGGNYIPGMTTLIRNECFNRVGRYDEGLSYEDYDFWLRAAWQYDFAFSEYVSAKYRIVRNSLIRRLSCDRLLEDHLGVLEKWFGISAPLDRYLSERITSAAHQMCKTDNPNRRKALRLMIKHNKSLRALGLYALTAGGTFRWSQVRPFASLAARVRFIH